MGDSSLESQVELTDKSKNIFLIYNHKSNIKPNFPPK